MESPNPSMVVVPYADMRSAGRCFQVMAQMAIDKIIPGPKLDALTAEKVFGWKKIHQHDDRDGFYGKRQDKAGYWRLAKVPQYSTNFLNAYSIERRMEQLGRLDRYLRELFRMTAKRFPLNGPPRINGVGPHQSCWAIRPGHSVEPGWPMNNSSGLPTPTIFPLKRLH